MSSFFVGNLSSYTSQEELKDFFVNFGEVKSVKIIHEKNSEESKCFAFVNMENIEQALKADGTSFLGRDLKIRRIRED